MTVETMTVKQLKDKSNNNIQPNAPAKCGYPQSSGTTLTSDATITATSNGWVRLWHNLSGTIDGSKGQIWIDGIEVMSANNGNSPSSFVHLFQAPARKGQTIKVIFPTGGGGTEEQSSTQTKLHKHIIAGVC